MSIPCFVSFKVFILKVPVFMDVMWSNRYMPIFQRKPCSLSFILKNMSIYIHGIRFQMAIFIPCVVYSSYVFHCKDV